MTRYVVTGGAGFIDSHLVEALAREGHEVRVLDDLSAGRIENLPETSRVQVVVGEVRDPDRVRPSARGADGIFHLAAGAGFPILRHILRLGPDIIKLDTFLTRGIDGDPVRCALAAGLVSFAARIGPTLTAEGIETQRSSRPSAPWACDSARACTSQDPRPVPAGGLAAAIRVSRLRRSPARTRRDRTPS